MSAFNTLIVTSRCVRCGNVTDHRYQFKYGDTWQYDYVLGDELRWGGNQNGFPLPGLVVIDAEAEPCPDCEYTYDFAVIYMDDGVFIGAGPNKNRFRFGQDDDALPIFASVSPGSQH